MSITTELSLITLNVNGLKCSNQKTGWLCGIKKQDHTYADRKDPLHIKKKNTERHTQTEREGMIKDASCK